MLYRLEDLRKVSIEGRDGPLGVVDEFYCDVEKWVVRYAGLVEDGQKDVPSLFAASQLGLPLPLESRTLRVDVSREQFASAPKNTSGQRISREDVAAVNRYYGWPNYWEVPTAQADFAAESGEPSRVTDTTASDMLHRLSDITNGQIVSTDADIGPLSTLIVDDTWDIQYLVIDATSSRLGKELVIPALLVKELDAEGRRIKLSVSSTVLQKCPPVSLRNVLDRAKNAESSLNDYYRSLQAWNV